MDDVELQNIYHTIIKSKNENSIRLIEMTIKDRALAKM